MIFFQITYCKFGKKKFLGGGDTSRDISFLLLLNILCFRQYFSSSALVLSWKIRFLLIFFISMFFSTSFALTFINNFDLIRPEKCALSYPDYLKKLLGTFLYYKNAYIFLLRRPPWRSLIRAQITCGSKQATSLEAMCF